MRFIIFNLKKDRGIILRNSLILALLMIVILQIYGSYFYRFEYNEKKFIEDRGIQYQTKLIGTEKIEEIRANELVDNIVINYKLSNYKVDIDNFKKFMTRYGDIRLMSLSKIDSKVVKSGAEININDMDMKILIPSELFYYANLSLGQSININGKKLTITGTSTGAYGSPFIISIDTAKNLGVKTAVYNIVPKKGLSQIEFNKLISKVNQIIGMKGSIPDYREETGNSSQRILPVLLLIMIISSFNLVLIYNYFLDLRKDRRLIYRMGGADRGLLVKSQFLEIILIFIISSVLSFIVIEAVDFILFKSVLKIYRFSLPFKNYLLIYVIYFVIYLLAIIFGNRKLLKKGLVG